MPIFTTASQLFIQVALFLAASWNSLAFGAAAVLSLRAITLRKPVWGGLMTGLVSTDLALNFLIQSFDKLGALPFTPGNFVNGDAIRDAAQSVLEILLPALLAHLFYSEIPGDRRRGAITIALIALYVSCIVCLILTVVAPFVQDNWRFLRVYAPPGSVALLGASSVLVAFIIFLGRATWPLSIQRLLLRVMLPTLAVIVVLDAIDVAAHLPHTLDILLALLPGGLLFITAYHVQPQTFDLLVKEGTFSFFLFALVTMCWLVLPVVGVRWASWQFGLALLVVWLILSFAPRLHSIWNRWIDRKIFGRKFTQEEARIRFLATINGAANENELCTLGERALTEIFASSSKVTLQAQPVYSQSGIQADIRIGDEDCGKFVVLSRPRGMQFLGEDIDLLQSLARELAIVLDNLRLRATKLAEEHRSAELQLLTTRAQIQALRAQINPHFLFNSLTAVAGLIGTNARHARETIEQLAEVFRYVLYRCDSEWVKLEEEVEFVNAYLSVERARFGPRLHVDINIEPSATGAFIPAMLLQVLVENAVEHGISVIHGQGILNIHARIIGARLCLEVRDNGPGFSQAESDAVETSFGTGLRNIRDRLKLHYGDAATLIIRREDAMTVVTLDAPIDEAYDPHESAQ